MSDCNTLEKKYREVWTDRSYSPSISYNPDGSYPIPLEWFVFGV
jgi:hypothetical protein